MNYLITEEILGKYNISRTTLWRWKKEGLRYFNFKNRDFFDEEEVDKFWKDKYGRWAYERS